MKIVNRGFLLIKPTQNYWNWANQFIEDVQFDEQDDCEGSIYLIEDDFFDIEPLLEKNFKHILKNELESVTEEENWPEHLDMQLFLQFFKIDFGTSVYDTLKTNIESQNLD